MTTDTVNPLAVAQFRLHARTLAEQVAGGLDCRKHRVRDVFNLSAKEGRIDMSQQTETTAHTLHDVHALPGDIEGLRDEAAQLRKFARKLGSFNTDIYGSISEVTDDVYHTVQEARRQLRRVGQTVRQQVSLFELLRVL